jgi:two-component system, OmpR family, response regulator ChvI
MTEWKRRILIVDDEPDVTFTLKKGLEEEGFQIDIFNDPLKAQSYFKAGEYDMLLLDINMPKLNGFELYRELKKIDNRVKVCFITAFELYYDEFRRVFPKLNVTCFVRKPITIDELAKILKQELQSV